MKFTHQNIQGLIVIDPNVFNDDRGYFYEAFREKLFSENGINLKFVQDNVSKSVKGTIRGLHYQIGEYAQGKLCQVLSGKVLDVAVDIRFGSPTFGKYFSIELSDESNKLLWIPPGFAHGFSVLSKSAIFYYKCSQYYSRNHERTIQFNDPDLNIDWKVSNPLVSHKDANGQVFRNLNQYFTFSN